MRWVVWLLVAFAAAVGLALLMRFNQGNIAVLWPPYRIDISVNLALAGLAIAFALMHLVLVGASRALGLPQRVREYRVRRQQEQAVDALRDTVLSFFEGRLGRAERFARIAQTNPSTSSAAALIAARAAHRMQERDRRDQWLKEASADPRGAQALLMSQAELAVEDRRTSEAIDLVEQIRGRGARHVVSLRTALRAYEQAGRWDEVLNVLRLVEKRDALHPAATLQLRVKAVEALLADKAGDSAAIRSIWKGLKTEERAVPGVASRVATAFSTAGSDEEARAILEAALDVGFDDSMVQTYGALHGVSSRDRLDRLEGWRQRYGDPPRLLLTLGRVCAAEKLWGKAEEYLVLATRREPTVDSHVALAELLEALGRTQEAAQQYRAAAHLARV